VASSFFGALGSWPILANRAEPDICDEPYCMAGLRGLELANVVFGKPLKYWPNSLWLQRTLWDLRPFAYQLAINIVEMTSAGSSPLTPGTQSSRTGSWDVASRINPAIQSANRLASSAVTRRG
jgi:hypothetical protein